MNLVTHQQDRVIVLAEVVFKNSSSLPKPFPYHEPVKTVEMISISSMVLRGEDDVRFLR
jgi:hypothetical protein